MRFAFAMAALIAASAIDGAAAQQPQQRGRGPVPGNRQNGGNQPPKEEYKPPEDPKVIKLYETFVLGAEKLAADYERTNQIDKARSVYEEIVRVAPLYETAQEKLKAIKMKESIAERKPFEVLANRGWQDTGVTVIAKKPVSIKATGSWSLKMSYPSLPPDGIEIPKELQSFPLGALIGIVVEPGGDLNETQPFLVGASKSFEPEKGGRLFLRIFDSDPEDNTGKMNVVIEGTFQK